jgi:hypothetical protein
MQLDKLTLRLRPRGPWEAMDLGAALLRANWKAVLGAWLALVLPLVALIHVLGPAPSSWVWLIVWWLKPLFDRVPLYVLSRAVFGETPRLHEVIRALPALLRTGVLPGLTYLRFDPWRSFNMPVRVLEGLRAREAGARGQLLRRRAGGHAFWLTFVCLAFWIVLSLALFGLINMLTPDPTGTGANESNFWELLKRGDANVPLWLYYVNAGLDFIAFSAIELLYVASGFTLYLNRRIVLEGWDIEVALRALAARVAARQEKQPWAAAAAVLCVVMLYHQEPVEAVEQYSKQIIHEVLAAPEFEQYQDITRWKYVGPEMKKSTEQQPERARRSDWEGFGVAVAQFARVIVWVALALLMVLIVWRISRWQAHAEQREQRAPPPPPGARQGKAEVEPPLPSDIVQAVQALLAAGQVRDALSLMYRAAALRLGARASDTEADCLGRARSREQALRAYVTNLVRAWQRAAYAQEASLDTAQLLLREWPAHFPHASDAPLADQT